MGLVLVACAGLGALLGIWLDGKFESKPWMMVSGMLLGCGAGFVELYRSVKRFIQ